jgi:ATP-dependent protease HslVU (ClpYQ) peptidase subunit
MLQEWSSQFELGIDEIDAQHKRFFDAAQRLYDDILNHYLSKNPDIRLDDPQTIFNFFVDLWKELHERYNFVNDQCGEEKDSPFGDLDSSFLIASANGLFHVGSDLSVTSFERYYAIGSGADYGLGALYTLYHQDLDARTIAERAVLAAIAFDTRCGGDIMVKGVHDLIA